MRRKIWLLVLLLLSVVCVGAVRRRVVFPVETRRYIITDPDSLSGSFTPVSPDATGNVGNTFWDENYLYICIAGNTWKRVALSTWTVDRDLRSIAGADIRAIGNTDIRTVEEY